MAKVTFRNFLLYYQYIFYFFYYANIYFTFFYYTFYLLYSQVLFSTLKYFLEHFTGVFSFIKFPSIFGLFSNFQNTSRNSVGILDNKMKLHAIKKKQNFQYGSITIFFQIVFSWPLSFLISLYFDIDLIWRFSWTKLVGCNWLPGWGPLNPQSLLAPHERRFGF